ncbi:ABC transporter substrate-binding protein [Chondromyces apiculatus]|uniref:Maltose/maltodextrin ABC transporter, substrate binding periplasmic protein MalE n=1 Tax=Chondromyces apiculatus DSM 436 TaxID=1192034 RepID=A0A017T3X9_9BACT|nr:ABC transporter substrate-binding protein [Chondromyces apiculatus]EYF03271.1 Maltose/maltodextrin ABC transporter, substrate binding periplasmic protein MalE [Chondromyces apiculatus DSM 436]
MTEPSGGDQMLEGLEMAHAGRENRRTFLAAGLLCPLAAALPGCRGDASAPSGEAETLPEVGLPAPAVPGADEARRHAGGRLTYYAESVGIGGAIDRALCGRFTADTGISVNVVMRPRDSTETYATYQRLFQARSPDVDVVTLDVIWPGTFAAHLVDLKPALGTAAAAHLEALVQNDTVEGRLVAMPWFTDFGMLYYRTDLLQKYGYGGPPTTWDELGQMAERIQAGERPSSRVFQGFVWQGKAYEGLTCNALEWVRSHGGGNLLEGRTPTVNNPEAARALARARSWIRAISPVGVTGYEEEDSRNVFQGGNAAFLRSWPYVYSAASAEGSRVKGRFDVAPMPHEPGQPSVATAGGWQLGVSTYTRHEGAATALVGYLSSPEVQRFRALAGGYIPTLQAVQRDPAVVRKLPFLERMAGATLVARPSSDAGPRYNEISIAFYQGVSKALHGTAPEEALEQIAQRMQRALR